MSRRPKVSDVTLGEWLSMSRFLDSVWPNRRSHIPPSTFEMPACGYGAEDYNLVPLAGDPEILASVFGGEAIELVVVDDDTEALS